MRGRAASSRRGNTVCSLLAGKSTARCAGVRECPPRWVRSVRGIHQMVVERAETPVMFKRVADEPGAITRGMQEVEEAVGLRGRKYYGAFDDSGDVPRLRPASGRRRSAGARARGRHPARRSLRAARLTGEPPEVYDLIGPTFERLSERPDRDRHVPASSSTGVGTSSTCCCRSSDLSDRWPRAGARLGWASVRECHPNGAVILRAWVDAARATRRGLTRKARVFERHG